MDAPGDMHIAAAAIPDSGTCVKPFLMANAHTSMAIPKALPVNFGATMERNAMPSGLASLTTVEATSSSSGALRVRPSSFSAVVESTEIEQKQMELRSVVERRISALEHTLKSREEELEALKAQLRKTEEDYKFNYELIKDRDIALEEASAQMQSLYDELRRSKAEVATLVKQKDDLEQEAVLLRQRLREAEVEREETVQQLIQRFEVKERQLEDNVGLRYMDLEREKQRLHEEYLRRFKALDDARVKLEEKGEVSLSEIEKWREKVHRLEEDLRTCIDSMEAAKQEEAVKAVHASEVAQAFALLKQEHESLQHKYNLALAEESEQRQKAEKRLTECNAIMSHGITTAEDAVRQQVQRANKLETECGQLQIRVTELQERLQETQLIREGDLQRFTEESREVQERYIKVVAQLREERQKLEESQRQQILRVQQLESELIASRNDCSNALCRVKEWQEKCEASDLDSMRYQRDVERLQRDLQHFREEEQRMGHRVQEIQRRADEKVLDANREAESARVELRQQQQRFIDHQERIQAESARLARELHASEVARHAIEEQYRLTKDNEGQLALINALQYDKETAERRVLELERTNAAIREQVSTFAMELQNDPMVKAAKETQRRVHELQEALINAHADSEKLRSAVHEKEEEVARYQLEVLRLQSVEAALLDYQEGFTILKEMHKGLHAASRGQQRKHQLKTRTCLLSSCKQMTNGERANRESSSSPVGGKAVNENAGQPSNMNAHQKASDKQFLGKDYAAVREVGSLRQRCLQLEKSVRDLLHERDNLTRELRAAQQDIEMLTNEKQHIVDLNSLLKAQLREAYRRALEHSQERCRQVAEPQRPAGPPPIDISSHSIKQPSANESRVGLAELNAPPESERITSLERELEAMKTHISFRHRGTSQNSCRPVDVSTSQLPNANASSVDRKSSRRNGAQIVRRGTTAVRHYGYL
ncbi:hypothetical protein TRVL_00677 [Trypanosoma vivax]|nr:hypothetical protein TRVL_00677 [Trypanosoma vivax]